MAVLVLFIVFIYMVMSAPTSSEDNSTKAKGSLAVMLSILAAPFVIIFKSSKRK